MQQNCFFHGVTLLFEHLPRGLRGDQIHDLRLNEPVREQLEGLPRSAFGRLAAGRGDRLRLHRAVELARSAVLLLPPFQGPLHAF